MFLDKLEPTTRLLGRPWFTRLWILQEAVLSQSQLVTCGSESCDLLKFLRFSEHVLSPETRAAELPSVREVHETLLPAVRGLQTIGILRASLASPKSLNLQNLTGLARPQKCKDSRDHV